MLVASLLEGARLLDQCPSLGIVLGVDKIMHITLIKILQKSLFLVIKVNMIKKEKAKHFSRIVSKTIAIEGVLGDR